MVRFVASLLKLLLIGHVGKRISQSPIESPELLSPKAEYPLVAPALTHFG